MILPLNKKTYIKSNISKMSMFAIVTSEAYFGRINAILSECSFTNNSDLRRYDLKDFSELTNKIKTKYEIGRVIAESNPYENNRYVYWRLKKNIVAGGKLRIHVDFLQDSNPLSSIKLVFSDEVLEKFNNGVSLTVSANGTVYIFDSFDGITREIKGIRLEGKYYLDLDISDEIMARYSKDGFTWTELYKRTNNIAKAYSQIGVCLHIEPNPFFYEFYLTHIQLCCFPDNLVIGPYFFQYEKNFSRMLKVLQIPIDILDIDGKCKAIDFFAMLINKKYYINMRLDEYFMYDRRSYNSHHFIHNNLIYGINKEKRIVYLMGFDNTIKYTELGFEKFYNSLQYEKNIDSKINLYRYESTKKPLEFNVELAIKTLKSYLYGKPYSTISNEFSLQIDCNTRFVFGLNIYNLLIENDMNLKKAMEDVRILYELYEHNLIMKNMVVFLQNVRVISEPESQNSSVMYEKCVKNSERILNIIIKNSFKKIDNLSSILKEQLIELKKCEKDATTYLINILEK